MTCAPSKSSRKLLHALPWMLFAVILVFFIIQTRVKYHSPYLFGWDGVQFALSIKHFDVRLHQPHPPGYLLYSYTLRLWNSFVSDANLAMISFNVAATIAACFLIALLVLELTQGLTSRFWLAAGAAALYASNPVCWLYSCVAEIYPVEGFFVALIAYLVILSYRRPQILLWSSVAMAIAGGFRPSTEVFLFPFYLTSFFGKNRKTLLISVALLLSINALWFTTLVELTGGFTRYFRMLSTQTVHSAEETSLLAEESTKSGLAPATIPFRLVQALTLPVLLALAFRCRKIRLSRRETALLLIVFPALFFFLFVHFPKDGYLLLVIPVLIAMNVVLLGKIYNNRVVLVSILLLACWINYKSFVKAPMYSTEETEASAYKLIVNGLTFPNKHVIRANTLRLRDFLDSVARIKPGRKLFVFEGDYFPNWRSIMYYCPDDEAVFVFPDRGKAYVATQQTYRVVKPPLLVSRANRLVVIISPNKPELDFASFALYEYQYYYAHFKELPNHFRLYSVPFVLEDSPQRHKNTRNH